MKIIQKQDLGDRSLGQVKCKMCGSELEIYVKDCIAGCNTGDSFCQFECDVCKNVQQAPPDSYPFVMAYQELKRKLEVAQRARDRDF